MNNENDKIDENKHQPTRDSQYATNKPIDLTNNQPMKGLSHMQPEFTSLNTGYPSFMSHQSSPMGHMYTNYTDVH